MQLLREAKRVSRGSIVIKDHRMNGIFARQTLRFMDDVGNKRFGVDLPYHYWSQERWYSAFRELELNVVHWTQDLAIHPWPASMLFDRGLHFMAQLDIGRAIHEPNTLEPPGKA